MGAGVIAGGSYTLSVINGGGTGSATLAYANTSTNSTFTLPTKTGTATLIGSSSAFFTPNTASVSNTGQVSLGFGSAVTFKPSLYTVLEITIVCNYALGGAVNNTGAVQLVIGTGAAPANGAAVTGTLIGANINLLNPTGANDAQPLQLTALVTGLTSGTRYYVDLAANSSASSVTISNAYIVIKELAY